MQASHTLSSGPLSDTDIFVADFLGLGQGSRRKLRHLRPHILHAIDLALYPPAASNPRRTAASPPTNPLTGHRPPHPTPRPPR